MTIRHPGAFLVATVFDGAGEMMTSSVQYPGGDTRPRTISLRWETTDQHPHLMPLVVASSLAAVLLAVVGLPPIDLHGPLHYVGVMDPMCGMTRAVRYYARGEMRLALRYNPAVPLLAAAGAAVVARWMWGQRTGRWARLSVRWSPLFCVAATLAIAVLWVHQQSNVDLLGP